MQLAFQAIKTDMGGHFEKGLLSNDSSISCDSDTSERTGGTSNLLLSTKFLEEVKEEKEEIEYSEANNSTFDLVGRLHNDKKLKKKLEQVITMLSSLKKDFN